MIHLVLDNLSSSASICFDARLNFKGLVLHLDCLMALALSWASKKRQTTFLGIARAVLLDDLGIEHHRVRRSSSTLIEKGDKHLLFSKIHILFS